MDPITIALNNVSQNVDWICNEIRSNRSAMTEARRTELQARLAFESRQLQQLFGEELKSFNQQPENPA